MKFRVQAIFLDLLQPIGLEICAEMQVDDDADTQQYTIKHMILSSLNRPFSSYCCCCCFYLFFSCKKTHFTLSLVLKNRVFGTRKWPVTVNTKRTILIAPCIKKCNISNVPLRP